MIENYEELIGDLIKNKITMVNINEFQSILNNQENIRKIDGDIVECGCWRGGVSIFLSHVFKEKNIWVCDSFKGFQPLTNAKYTYEKSERHVPSMISNAIGPIAVSLEETIENFKKYGLGDDPRIKFVKGFVKDSLPTTRIEKIALLRIDVDAYSATLEVLDELYDKVQPGGYIIFDDACIKETFAAIVRFLKEKNLPPYLLDPLDGLRMLVSQKYAKTTTGFPAGSYIIKGNNDEHI